MEQRITSFSLYQWLSGIQSGIYIRYIVHYKEVENENEIKIPDIQLCPQRLGYGL